MTFANGHLMTQDVLAWAKKRTISTLISVSPPVIIKGFLVVESSGRVEDAGTYAVECHLRLKMGKGDIFAKSELGCMGR